MTIEVTLEGRDNWQPETRSYSLAEAPERMPCRNSLCRAELDLAEVVRDLIAEGETVYKRKCQGWQRADSPCPNLFTVRLVGDE